MCVFVCGNKPGIITCKNLSKYVAGGEAFESIIAVEYWVGSAVIRSSFVLPCACVAVNPAVSASLRASVIYLHNCACAAARLQCRSHLFRRAYSPHLNPYLCALCQLVVTVIHGGFTAACAHQLFSLLAYARARFEMCPASRHRG